MLPPPSRVWLTFHHTNFVNQAENLLISSAFFAFGSELNLDTSRDLCHLTRSILRIASG